MPRPTYRFDTDGHTVVTQGDSAKKKDAKLEFIFELFKGFAFGEAFAIGLTLMAQLYIMYPNTSIGLITSFQYWAIRMFGGEVMVFAWFVIGTGAMWGFDTTDTRMMS